ncbi:MAG TPA: PEP-CTERM sorting domain-containing protein [Fimbriimonadaceae bacterium]|nr:PEP-CTERM sorting domain-containing protein [Fimbriimonadaceae bacterium]HRJ95614.1 PEP-CTERM sorting domain-containing protein [Fimbriimonadaceae bacterium]
MFNITALRTLAYCGLTATTCVSQAIVMRHDKADRLYRELAANDKYAAVGLIEWKVTDGDTEYGTANYIGVGTGGKKWLVTAGHNLNEEMDWCRFTIGGHTYDIELQSRRWVDPPEEGLDDIGVARILDPRSRLTLRPARFWNDTIPIPANVDSRTIGTAVGFGRPGTGTKGMGNADKVKRAMTNRIDGLNVRRGDDETVHGYLTDFDRNDRAHNMLDAKDVDDTGFPNSQRSSRTWLDLEGQIAPGDSGGGLFAEVNGITAMVGITSGTVGLGVAHDRYGAISKFTPFNRALSRRVTGWTGIKAVPEPSSLVALGVAVAGLIARKRRRR